MRRVGLLLLPGFGLGSLAGVVDTLQASQTLMDGAVWQGLPLSADGGAVRAAGGTWVSAAAMTLAPPLALALVVADGLPDPADPALPAACHWLQAQAAAGVPLGGVGTGAAWLAEAGLLAGHRATVHWPHIASLAERHPAVILSQQCFEIDRGRLSCAGFEASRDLMIAWLAQHHGERLAQDLAAAFGLERLRGREERQRVPSAARGGVGSAKLAEAVALMEANLGEPLSAEDIAGLVGVSRRQLERLFKQHLDALPSRWYQALRLARARRLLRETPQSILQIGLACGFASGPHFSNAYRGHFGHTPRDERSQWAQAWRDGASAASASGATGAAHTDPVGATDTASPARPGGSPGDRA
jgi:transcriptional regulator GlxA family with amidase domain